MALTSKQRAALRSAANTMDPVYQIGKGEIDDTLKQASRLHRRTRAYQSKGAGKQRIFRPRGRRHPVRGAGLRVRAGHWPQIRAVQAEKKGKRLHRRAGKMRTLLYGGTSTRPTTAT